jgi:hypothetical protein
VKPLKPYRGKLIPLSVDVLRMIVEMSMRGQSRRSEVGCSRISIANLDAIKEKIMKKKCASILLTLTCFLGLGVAARATTRVETVVTLPFEFVVSGKTFPAGTYKLSRVSDDKLGGLVFGNDHASVFVNAITVASASSDKPQVSFERVGEQHFLSSIRTANDVYSIPVPRAAIMEATARQLRQNSTAGTSGGN